ncbi:MAG: pyridoxamine 5'-phosphate oxidase family protein [Ardenticatenaceae bacterium]|nr:pyridoxamine 5'-phosphate oxidase family protein [Ardenticatenaceae bacterium]
MRDAASCGRWRLATAQGDQPFLNSNLFVYDEAAQAIYPHTARVGRTAANLASEAKICFTVFEMGRLLPADEALEFSVEYSGVTVFGSAVTIEDPVEAKHGLQLLLDKYAPHLRPDVHYRGITPEELKRTAVYRINIHEWSGKKKQVAEDFPGAFYYS